MVAIHSFNRLKHKWRNFGNLYNMVSIIRECYIKTLTRINWEQTFIWIQSLWTAIVRRIAGEQLKGKRKACLNISWTKFIFSLQQNKTSRTVWNDAQKTSSLQSKGKKSIRFSKKSIWVEITLTDFERQQFLHQWEDFLWVMEQIDRNFLGFGAYWKNK